MMKYVVGLAWDKVGRARNGQERLLLIQKNRPDWQAGKLNGVGGKVEPGDSCIARAMQREFWEEAGVGVEPERWRLFCEFISGFPWDLEGPEHVYFYTVDLRGDEAHDVRSVTDEELRWVEPDRLPALVLPNLRWLVPMARCEGVAHAVVRWV